MPVSVSPDWPWRFTRFTSSDQRSLWTRTILKSLLRGCPEDSTWKRLHHVLDLILWITLDLHSVLRVPQNEIQNMVTSIMLACLQWATTANDDQFYVLFSHKEKLRTKCAPLSSKTCGQFLCLWLKINATRNLKFQRSQLIFFHSKEIWPFLSFRKSERSDLIPVVTKTFESER